MSGDRVSGAYRKKKWLNSTVLSLGTLTYTMTLLTPINFCLHWTIFVSLVAKIMDVGETFSLFAFLYPMGGSDGRGFLYVPISEGPIS